RAGDRRCPRVWLIEAPSSYAAQEPFDGFVEPARAASADELRTASRDHASLRRVEARSGEDPHRAGIGRDHLRRLAGGSDEYRACVLWGWKLTVCAPVHLPPAWRGETSDAVLAQGAGRTPDSSAWRRRPAPVVRAGGHHAVHADDRYLDRVVLA